MKMQEIDLQDVVLACVGTDGTDGSTDTAGAIVNGGIVNKNMINDAKDALKNHNTYSFLEHTKLLMISCKITGLLNSKRFL
jgi:glycerate 2-kinase